MPFGFKLSHRLSRIKVFALAAVLTACEVPNTGPDQTRRIVGRVLVSPDSVVLDPNQTLPFRAFGRTTGGDSVPISVIWSASAGTITQDGFYTADSSTSDAVVTATYSADANLTGSSSVKKRSLVAIVLTPASASVLAGGTAQFSAYGRRSTGDSVAVNVTFSATGGTISGGGLYTAGSTAGTYRVIARQNGGSLADTAAVLVTGVPIAAVVVSPSAASVTVGATVQLAATATDSAGNPLSGQVITWASSNSAVTTVSASGVATGVSVGSAEIRAVVAGVADSAQVTVAAATSAPGAVTDLTVTGVTDSSVSLRFTEVGDGTGSPASYDVRYARSPISWSTAASVTIGTCRTPVAGSAVGASRTCTVLGLTASTAYDFQMVAFRGTLNAGAVFGALSNVASGTTATAAAVPVVSVTVSPSSVSLGVGQATQLSATPRDEQGNVLTGRLVTWSSAAPAVAGVSSTGLVTAVASGSTTITATSEGHSGTAGVTVTSGSTAGEPAILSGDVAVFADSFSEYASTTDLLNSFANRQSHGTISLDGTTFGGNKAFKVTYNNDGCLGSYDADVLIEKSVANPNAASRDWFLQYQVAYQPGYQFWWGANIGSCPRGNASKEAIIFRDPNNTTGGRISVLANTETACPAIYGSLGQLLWNITIDQQPGDAQPSGCGSQRIKQHLALATKGPAAIADGQLHRVTLYIHKESASDVGDGIVRMWVDGVLVIDYNGDDPANAAYHRTYTRLNGFGAPIQFPTVINAGAPQQESRWLDNVLVWYRP
jgi:uncharacterized protein YjdB